MPPTHAVAARAVRLRITGVVQGVGFRPFVYRVAHEHGVTGWVLNGEDGVHVVAEGSGAALEGFLSALRAHPPPASHVATFETQAEPLAGFTHFTIRESTSRVAPSVRISPDLAVCDDCLRELFDPGDRRFGYPYINCTNCGPRYSIVLGLPYDRPRTTMRGWPLCAACQREYDDPADRRFHAQPVACPACGPAYHLEEGEEIVSGPDAVARSADLLAHGAIIALKGIGGYHLACDAENSGAVHALRERKYRKERPFAVMARDLATAQSLIVLNAEAQCALTSIERPIVLAPAKRELPGVAPDNRDLGVMLPYTPLHHLIFAAGAPPLLIMTSANRSSEPIAYLEDDAHASLAGIADAFLIGARPIARRMDDAVVRVAPAGRTILRRARGLAPMAVAQFPPCAPILALGGDLKNALTLVVEGQAFASQHIGDLGHLSAQEAFLATVHDLCAMYAVVPADVQVVHDLHPGYHSTQLALELSGTKRAVQHHRAHIASVLAERDAWDAPVIGFAFDGTGYGDDGTIWGGEVFSGSLKSGLDRVAHLLCAPLPGGDAAARFPIQAAAGFLAAIDDGIDFAAPPFAFGDRYLQAQAVLKSGVQTFTTSSIGRLFDAVAALCGFTREQTFEGQAAMWLEHIARGAGASARYTLPFADGIFDYRPFLKAAVVDRRAGEAPAAIARGFHVALANAVIEASKALGAERVVISGGVFQNGLLVELLATHFGARLWCNTAVPPNDGGLSLGQAALACAALSQR